MRSDRLFVQMQNATPRDMVVTPREMTMMGPAIVLPTQVGAPYDRKPDIEVSAAMERGKSPVSRAKRTT